MADHAHAATLETSQVEAFLAGHFGRECGGVASVGSGWWSQAFSFRHEGDDYVIRFGAYDEDFKKDRFVARYTTPDLPIPRVREIGQAFGGHFVISERVFGRMLDALDPPGMRRVVPAVLRALDAMRTADVRPTSGYGGWDAVGTGACPRWRDYLLEVGNEPAGSRIRGWQKNLSAFPERARVFRRLLTAFEGLTDVCPEDRHLLHTDLLYKNVLVTGDRIAGVLDWGNSLYGDFLYELALLSFSVPWYASMAGIDWAAEARRHYEAIGLDVPNFGERLRCYELHIGLGGLAFSAFSENWEDFDVTARRASRLV